jgi:hypothetical protein
METQDEFFSPKHKLLMDFALLANILAWLAVIFYILRSLVTVLQYQISLLGTQAILVPFQDILKFWSLLADQPFSLLYMIVTILNLLLRGAIFYLVLKSISLGLDMIVETDVNYRGKQKVGGEQ